MSPELLLRYASQAANLMLGLIEDYEYNAYRMYTPVIAVNVKLRIVSWPDAEETEAELRKRLVENGPVSEARYRKYVLPEIDYNKDRWGCESGKLAEMVGDWYYRAIENEAGYLLESAKYDKNKDDYYHALYLVSDKYTGFYGRSGGWFGICDASGYQSAAADLESDVTWFRNHIDPEDESYGEALEEIVEKALGLREDYKKLRAAIKVVEEAHEATNKPSGLEHEYDFRMEMLEEGLLQVNAEEEEDIRKRWALRQTYLKAAAL